MTVQNPVAAPPMRILGQDVTVSMNTDDGSASAIGSLSNVDSFSWKFTPEILRFWPAGQKKPLRQAVNGVYEVTITGGQVGGGFASFITAQSDAVTNGNKVPLLTVTRTATTTSGNLTQTFTNGIVTSGGGDQGEGNKDLTNTITIEFETMS